MNAYLNEENTEGYDEADLIELNKAFEEMVEKEGYDIDDEQDADNIQYCADKVMLDFDKFKSLD